MATKNRTYSKMASRGFNYTEDYTLIFSSCRRLLVGQIRECLEFIYLRKKLGHPLSLKFLCFTAEFITAYNELSNLSFFVKTRHFNLNG